MNTSKLTALMAACFLSISMSAQYAINLQNNISEQTTVGKPFLHQMNFYIADKPKKLDIYSRLVILRARKQAITRGDGLIVIVASSTKEIKEKVLKHLQEKNGVIGSIWFDSHGRYKNGYSSFIIGDEEFSYRTIHDSIATQNLHALQPYCDENTRVGIGSCYGGATYEKPAYNGRPASRMNGDSLMIGLANVFSGATVYGTEGWVMAKPGTFKKYSYALAGYPIQKRFKDEVYRPVWEHIGIWHSYSTLTQTFNTVNTLSLTHTGAINVKAINYLQKEKYKKRQQRNLKKLRPGVMKA